MTGMFKFSCGSQYGSHSYSAVDNQAEGGNTVSPDFRSFLHAQSNQYGGGVPQPGPTGRVYEVLPGVRADEAFDVFVFLVALAMVAAAVLGTCFFIAWFSNLHGNAVQQRGAYGMPIAPSAYSNTVNAQSMPYMMTTGPLPGAMQAVPEPMMQPAAVQSVPMQSSSMQPVPVQPVPVETLPPGTQVIPVTSGTVTAPITTAPVRTAPVYGPVAPGTYQAWNSTVVTR